MSAPKLVRTASGLLLKAEASYNAGGTLAAATDGVQLSEPSVFTIDYADKAERKYAVGSATQDRRSVPSGRFITGTVKTRFRGPGVAFSASVNAQDLHTIARICGMGVTLSTTGGSEKNTYAPVSTGYTSAAGEFYSRGQKYPFQAAYGDLTITAEAGKMVDIVCDLMALMPTDLSDVACPAVTYPYQAIQPPKFESGVISINGVTSLLIRSAEFKTNWTRVPRLSANTTTHAGFSMIERAPTIKFDIEEAALATFDPNALYKAGTSIAVSYQVGTVQYNRLKVSAPTAQIVDVQEGDDSGQGIWTVTVQCNPTTPAANDDFSLVTD